MITCPNKNLTSWKNLVTQVGESKAYYLWNKHKGNVPTIPVSNINYSLAAIDILSSDKAKQVFEKGKKNSWDLKRILDELEESVNDTSSLNQEVRQKLNSVQKELQAEFKKKSEQDFIKSIFPDTTLNKIVYHGTKNKNDILKDGFKNNSEIYKPDDDRAYESGELGYGYYFTDTIENANVYGEEVPVILNTPNIENETTFDLLSTPARMGVQYFVKDKKQIHIITEEEQSSIKDQSKIDSLKEQLKTLKQELKDNETKVVEETKGISKEQKQIILDKYKGKVSEINESEITYTDDDGNLCAKMGMKSDKFTKGGKWEKIKEFKGASHERGGIDIEIGNGGIKMSGKQGKFEAKFGLVINKKFLR